MNTQSENSNLNKVEHHRIAPKKQKSFISVEGPIGVGKTILTKKLAETYQSELLLEGTEENPFLERFYQEPEKSALPAQLYFLFQRIQKIQELRQGDMFAPSHIADFLMDKDRLFARTILSDDELNLYEQVYNNLTIDAPEPDLVIYLQAPVDVLIKKIRKRSHSMEEKISDEYLKKLSTSYTNFFHYYNSAPLLIVNVSSIDLINNENHYQHLLEQIEKINHGRHYFNPIEI